VGPRLGYGVGDGVAAAVGVGAGDGVPAGVGADAGVDVGVLAEVRLDWRVVMRSKCWSRIAGIMWALVGKRPSAGFGAG
jgi:hypothetical protein